MIQPIILAAGKGTRMQSDKPKVLHEVQGKPMLEHVLTTLHKVRHLFMSPIVVVGHQAGQIRSRYPNLYYVEQKVLNGTAKAVEAAVKHTQNHNVLVMCGDNPFVKSETLQNMCVKASEGSQMVLGVVEVPHFNGPYEAFWSFGRVIYDPAGFVRRIIEYKDATEADRNMRVLNSGLCTINRKWLVDTLPKIKRNQKTDEYYLTDLVGIAHLEGYLVDDVEMEPIEAFGVNRREDLATLEELRKAKM